MNYRLLPDLSCSLRSSVITVALSVAAAVPAIAAPLTAAPLTADWTYTLDSFNDGTEAQTVGDASTFEIYGMAYRQQGRTLTFALNSNLAVNQLYERPNTALNNSINYGDLLLNFSSESSFSAASADSLYGIRFDAANDTALSLGLYGNVTPQSLASVNDGYASFALYDEAVQTLGGEPSMGGIEQTPYFDPAEAPPTHIASGNYLGAVQLLDAAALSGLSFADWGAVGQHTFGFSIDAGLLPAKEFIAHLLTECANDGIAFASEIAMPVVQVPEPPQSIPDRSSAMPILGASLGLGWILRRRRRTPRKTA